jgi:hypothetical protein
MPTLDEFLKTVDYSHLNKTAHVAPPPGYIAVQANVSEESREPIAVQCTLEEVLAGPKTRTSLVETKQADTPWNVPRTITVEVRPVLDPTTPDREVNRLEEAYRERLNRADAKRQRDADARAERRLEKSFSTRMASR